jgi:hypothetical protein
MLKRQQSEPPDAGRSRKKPKVCDNNSKSKESPERSSASATAVNRPSKMQPPPPPPSSQDTGSASSILHQMFSTNSLQQHPTTYLTASVACETDNINFPFSPPVYDPTSTPTSEMDYQQIQQPQTSTVSQAMQQCGGGLTQSCSTPHSSSDSPSTVAQSDESASPSSARRRHVVRQTEESHPCEKCNKQFPRACDLK